MAKDVFVSYSSHDKVLTDKLCMILEEMGLDCWDILPGAEFDIAILDGIDQCQAMVVILTPEANVSLFVTNEKRNKPRRFSRPAAGSTASGGISTSTSTRPTSCWSG